MRNKKAISQTLAVVIVVLIIAVAFGGYAVGTLGRGTTTLYGTPASLLSLILLQSLKFRLNHQ